MNNPLKKPIKNTSTILNLALVLYAIFVFCFNENTENIIYVYISCAVVLILSTIKIFRNLSLFEIHRESILLIVYALYCASGVLWAQITHTASRQAFTIFLMVIFAVIMIMYFTATKNISPIFYSLTIAGVILSIYAIYSYGGISEFYTQASIEGARLGSKIGQINTVGMHCAYTVVMLFYYAFYKKKYILYPVIILPFIVSMGSGSRKALLIVLLGILLMIYLSQEKKRYDIFKVLKVAGLLCIAIVAFVLILQLPIMKTIYDRMISFIKMLLGEHGDYSSELRYRMISIGWNQFKNTPIFGIGAANAQFVNLTETGHLTYLHNDFIEQLVNFGIVGFSLYYGLLVLLLIKHIRLLKTRTPEIIVSFILLVIFLINSWGMVTYYNKTTYLFMVLWISVVTIYSNKVKRRT